MDQTFDKAKQCVETNYYGTKRVTEALLPLMKLSASARIINITSFYGQIKFINNENIKSELRNTDSLTVEKLDRIMQQFLQDFEEDNLQANGWPVIVSAYKVSKAAVNAYTRITAAKYPSMVVNCIHPGLVKTKMTCYTGNLTAEEGARGPVTLALSPDNSPSGLYYDEMTISSF